jgi:uncharacterized protein (TIGR02646 family)
MIHVDRKRVPPPQILWERSRRVFPQLEEFFKRDLKFRGQRVPPFDLSILKAPEVAMALDELFRRKCAFCESSITEKQPGIVDHFRPRLRAAQIDGRVDPDHYWWLAYEWDNLYASCQACSHAKGSRFPVAGQRVAPMSGGTDLDSESRLLLDPCNDEHPDESLDFAVSGMVMGRDERGMTTVDIFALNRQDLIKQRRERCFQIDELAMRRLMKEDAHQWTREQFAQMMADDAMTGGQTFIALTRQQAARCFDELMRRSSATAESAAEKKEAAAAPPAAAEKMKRPAYRGAVWLDRVEIENFRAIRHLNLQFPSFTPPPANVTSNTDGSSDEPGAPWLMLLGENAVGKSSVLKAIALALMPEAQRSKLMKNPRDWLRRPAKGESPEGVGHGLVRLSFTVGADPIELHITPDRASVIAKGERPNVAVLGYGSTRLLPAPAKAPPRPQRIRVENLFDSRAALRDAERWLASADRIEDGNFDLLATALKTILSLSDEDSIIRPDGKLSAQLFDDLVPIRELSDGYQSVLALATDMMLNLSRATFDMAGVEGVVLIDELEVHLHPRWKIHIVSALRKMFPRVRFIATTHDPLCVQGLKPGELHVMARHPESKEVRIEQVDVPPGTRADQILTGAWFGLPSTRDPETLALMREHSELLLKLNKTGAEESRLKKLEAELNARLEEYAGTSIQRLGLQVAQQVADEQQQAVDARVDTDAEREQLKAKILDRLRTKVSTRPPPTQTPPTGAA